MADLESIVKASGQAIRLLAEQNTLLAKLATSKLTEPEPEPEPEPTVTVANGKLIVNGVVDPIADGVVALGTADGYELVHVNTLGWWWGRDLASGRWKQIPETIVTTDYVPDKTLAPADDLPPYTEAYPSGEIKFQLLSPADDPIVVDPDFLGTHLDLTSLPWQHGGKLFPMPAPMYPFGRVRTLRSIVSGLVERGFWCNVEVSPGVYDWQYLDTLMAAAKDHPVLFLIYGTPKFYQKYPGEPSRWPSWPGIASPPVDSAYAALKDFARAVKARYGDQIAGFEVWNEPTLPWTSTGYGDRWSAEWGRIHRPEKPTPFFSGSASDLANIAFTLNTADLGVPIYGCAFVDTWRNLPTETPTRFYDAPVTLPGGYGTGKDHIQKVSVHTYDYRQNPLFMLSALDGYRDQARKAGIGHLPMVISEIGAEDQGVFKPGDSKAVIAIERWTMLAALKRIQEMYLYGHITDPEGSKFIGGAQNKSIIEALTRAYGVGGMVLRKGVVMRDGRVWLHGYKDGKLITMER